MDAPIPLCTLSQAGQRYLCHGQRRSPDTGNLDIFVTDGVDVWRSDLTKEAQEEWLADRAAGSSSDALESLRELLQRAPPVLDIQGNSIALSIPLSPDNVTLNLFKLPVSETRTHVQSLVFSLVDRLKEAEKLQKGGSAAPPDSPAKPRQRNDFIHIPDVDARRRGYGISAPALKKRLPGESLVNPGYRRKKAATGVDFDDA